MKRLIGLAAIMALSSGTAVLAQAAGAAAPGAAPAAGAVNPPAASTGAASQTPAARTNPLTPNAGAATSNATGVNASAPPAAGAVNPPVGAESTTTTAGSNGGVGVNASTSSDSVIGNTPAGQPPSAYPTCTTRTQDRCMQKGAGKAMKSRPAPASSSTTTG